MRAFCAAMVLLFAPALANAGIIFEETGGSLSSGTAITSSNTSFTYVRSGTGGSIVAVNPGSFTGTSIDLGGSTGQSLTGVGWATGFGNPALNTVTFQMTSTNLTAGNLFFGLGSGSMFIQDTTFNTGQLSYGFQSDNGLLQRRTSSAWSNVGFSLTNNTAYSFRILSNRSGAAQSYTGGMLANNTIDLYLNDTLIGDDLAFTNTGVAADAFRIYQINGGARFELDNIRLSNTLDTAAVPEPTHGLLLSLALCLALWRTRASTRQRKSKNGQIFPCDLTAEHAAEAERPAMAVGKSADISPHQPCSTSFARVSVKSAVTL